MADPDLLRTALVDVVGERGVLVPGVHDDRLATYAADWRGAYAGRPALVVLPSTTDEVAAVLRACAAHGAAVVPQGGNTGLCGGAVPDASGTQVVVSTDRLRAVRDLDVANRTLTVEAGVVLADAQAAAGAAGLLLPLTMGSQGRCTVGGVVATNAGGTGVLRYGSTRALVLGLEVVLPDGRVWDGLRGLRKDNTGYDLKQLFVGAEGTLGVVTAVVLALQPAVRRRVGLWVGLDSLAAAVGLLGTAREVAGERVTAFEVMSAPSRAMVLDHVPGTRDPLGPEHPWCGLVELGDTAPDADVEALAERLLTAAAERDQLVDAVVATGPQLDALWALREGISEAQNHEGPSLKHDVSVALGSMADYVAACDAGLARELPGVRVVAYGHVGDGNLHHNLSKPPGTDDADFLALAPRLTEVLYAQVAAHGGSISAEHGLGTAKRDAAAAYKSDVELDLMRAVKRAIDPDGRMNPGKVLAAS
ncbi:FAD-binding oxidoreductase [Nocardioides zeae]|uniref:FAD-binding oxidoreductase n=1 Tax=Nocardioides imazamoxiresistens TaxID=3231893 RepID=A0ABU3PSB1_9ACTN|nr:FAD-binding oxidoreductase [Nocardioides zeae]MDT9592084.1 FAD-binding oxidoreductase [Nocardioides zeae]